MNKIGLIIEREYITRVRKRSFLLISILAPILLIALMVVPTWLTSLSGEEKYIQVSDEGNLFGKAAKIDNIHLLYTQTHSVEAIRGLAKNKEQAEQEKQFDAILFLPRSLTYKNPDGAVLLADKNISYSLESKIKNKIASALEKRRLIDLGINPTTLAQKAEVSLKIQPLQSEQQRTDSAVASVVAYLGAFLIYFFIFLFGVQVMRGVMEEKNNRIVEVIISSVKPFELIMGKIIGVALVAFTQFVIWIMLGGVLFVAVSAFFSSGVSQAEAQEMLAQSGNTNLEASLAVQKSLTSMATLNFPLIIFSFGFYFIMGYLVYGAMFGAIGSLVDNQTDSQQFMMPITIPLIVSVAMIGMVIKDPNSSLAFWMSIIPLTSPIIMMVRIPFEPSAWEIVLSMVVLIITFVGSTWVVGKIYRTAILMYGKKPTYKEISKWLFYKN